MPQSSAVNQYLPFLRRYARALTGNQASGDAYVAATLEALIADLRTMPSFAGRSGGGSTVAGLLEQFCALLSRHIRREENELFQHVQAVLPRETLDRLGRQIDRRAVRICLPA